MSPVLQSFRSSADMDTGTTTPDLVPSRRKTVKFKETTDIPSIIGTLNRITDGIYVEEDRKIIESFLSSEVEDAMLISWLKEMKDNMSVFGKKSDCIVKLIWELKWYEKPPHVIEEYQDLVLNLVSAYPYHQKTALQMILRIFLCDNVVLIETDDIFGPEYQKVFLHAHQLLQKLLLIAPFAIGTLVSLISDNFPYMHKEIKHQVCYVGNVIQIMSYLPAKQKQEILELLIDRLLQIDVHCPREEIEYAESIQQEPVDKNKIGCMKHPLANVFDLLMDELLNFIHSSCFKRGKLDWEATKWTFKSFLTVFDRYILPTYASSHVQFVLFYISSFDSRLHESFFDYLWKKTLNLNTAPVLRQAAAAYIGSLLSRALYIPISTAKACFEILSEWIHQYIDYQATKGHITDPTVHFTFYAVCQAIFYAIIFRHKEILELEDGLVFLRRLNFDRIITSSLNPLRYCQQEITKRFASIMRHYQLAYCYTVIEHNTRCSLPVMVQAGDGLKSILAKPTLDTFFPFDPYLLKKSSSKIQPLYRVYVNNDVTKGSENCDFLSSTFAESIKRTGSIKNELLT